MSNTVLWWGRFDPEYSRNRIIRQAFSALGWTGLDFVPRHRGLAHLEARLKRTARPGLIYVPCFCARDAVSAWRFGRHHGIPVLFDPLISLYDTRVGERRSVAADSRAARRLLRRERHAFGRADGVIADTEVHGRYFSEVLGVEPARIHVIPVSAEEPLFSPGEPRPAGSPVEILFYGSFIPLQGVEVIVEAIRHYAGPPVRWRLLGKPDTADQAQRERELAGFDNVVFEGRIPYADLPRRIQQADILLGIFGSTEKTVRVIPNKVYQAMACARPVITCEGPYPRALRGAADGGLRWVPPGDPAALARAVAELAAAPERLPALGLQARRSYERHFSNAHVAAALAQALERLFGTERRHAASA